MKFTKEQETEMTHLKKKVKELLLKYGATRSMRNLQFDIANIRDENFKTLGNFKISYGWISKMKTKILKPKARSVVKQANEENLLAWIRSRKKNPLSALVTTSQVKKKWTTIYGKAPTRYALNGFKSKYGIQVIFDSRTKNTNSWIFTN